MEPLEWIFLGYQIYKGLKFGCKVNQAMIADKKKAEEDAKIRTHEMMTKAQQGTMDEVDLCNLLSDFLEMNFDHDGDGALSQAEVIDGIKKMKQMAREATGPQMRQCALDYLVLLAWAHEVNRALQMNERQTVQILASAMKPGEECDPDRVHIELIVISFIRHPKFNTLAHKLGGGGGSPSRRGSQHVGPEMQKLVVDEFTGEVKDMCVEAVKEEAPALLKCVMEELPMLLL
mmetsp:Transcript_33608/g.62988  ORF Transcript_33608/g.62988 Transcript_33608/m.62988 type:complete len:232 (-) Transcript_33608:125-820(-)